MISQSYGPLRLFPSCSAFGEVHRAGFRSASIFFKYYDYHSSLLQSYFWTPGDPLLNFLCFRPLRKLLLMNMPMTVFVICKFLGQSTLGTEETMLHGQRALRLWLELIALSELFVCQPSEKMLEGSTKVQTWMGGYIG